MDLHLQIDSDLKQALRSKDQVAVLTLRQIMTALKNAEIAQDRTALTAEQQIKVLQSEVKKRRESAELYDQGGRGELAQKERAEIEIISNYLPAAMSEEAIVAIIDEVIAQTQAATTADFGKVIGAVMAKLQGKADGAVVSQLIKARLK